MCFAATAGDADDNSGSGANDHGRSSAKEAVETICALHRSMAKARRMADDLTFLHPITAVSMPIYGSCRVGHTTTSRTQTLCGIW